MPDDWSRRALLSSLGTIAIAGCTGSSPDSGSPSATTTVPPNRTTPTTTTHGTTTDRSRTASSTSTQSEETETTTTPQGDPEPPTSIDASWPMPARDPGLSNFAPNAPGPTAAIAELWTASIDTELSTPIVHDETLYVGGRDGTVRAFDARTGDTRWQQSIGANASAPRVQDDRLFVPTNGAIVALEPKDGSEVWRTETPNRVDADGEDDEGGATVLVAPHGIYWISTGETTAVVGVEPNDGSERWRTEISEPWTPRLFASQETVFVSTGTHSNRPWTIAPDTGSVTGSKPSYGHDFPADRFYLDGSVYGVDPFFGVVHGPGWTAGGEAFRAGRRYGLSGGASNVFYVPKNDHSGGPGLLALTQQAGETAWSTDAVGASATRPIVAAETVLVATDKTLYCFDPSDGTERWTKPIEDVGRAFVVVDDLVYATHDGEIRAFRPP